MKTYIIFRNGATKSNEVAYSDDLRISAPDVAVEWSPGGDSVAENYTRNGKALTYTPPMAPPPVPDLLKFNQMFSYATLIERIFDSEQYLLSQMAQNIPEESIRNAWLREAIMTGTREQQAALVNIAIACNVPLPAPE